MPLYFFDIADGRLIQDECGQELPDIDAAREEAVASARSIMRDEIWQGRLPLNECIRILGADRELLAVIPFRETIDISE